MRRLKSLDAMRGFSVLAMLPFHILVFGGLMMGLFAAEGINGNGNGGAGSPELFVVDVTPPLSTGLLIFFFVTGMSLAASLAKRRETQNPPTIARHIVLRYGSYMLLGVVSELIMRVGFWGETNLLESISEILFSVSSFSSPIIGLALGAIIAFPLVLSLSWKKLGVVALVLASIVGVVLYYVVLPQASSYSLEEPSVLNLLLTGWFGILKGIPVILYGAVIGKLVINENDSTKIFFLVGGAITAAYILVPTILGTGMVHIVFAVWTYSHAIIFISGLSIAMFAVFRALESRKAILNPLTVLGRLSIITYYGHWLIDVALWMLIGPENLTLGMLLGMMMVVTAIVWVALYFYGRWRWGPISTWYG